ncbi:MAG: holo-ACP synthase, partial [Simkaniaceae bacterium]|nr:holo-ACP synthase [Simkaniaceae bacterium]
MPDITGVGVDLIEIERIRHSIDSYGDAFLNKLFTKNEMVGFEKYKDPAPHISGRFAAKEAVAKSLGTGIGKD